MVPGFFLCLFLEEKSLFACGILRHFRAISGLLVAKVLQIFSALYPLYHKGLRLFRQGRLLQIFFKRLPCRMPDGLSPQFAAPDFYDHSEYKHSASCPSCCVQPNTGSPLRPIQLQKDV